MWAMKKLLLTLLLCTSAFGQSTTVTGTVTDTGGVAWANGSFAFTFVGPQNVNWTGGALNTSLPIAGSLDAGGNILATSIPDNNQINPGGTQWAVRACSATIPQVCSSSNLTITGTSQVLTLTPP